MGLWRRLYGTGHEASGQGHYGSGKLQRTQPAGDQRRREPEGDPDLVRVDRLRSHACQYLPQRWAETLEAARRRLPASASEGGSGSRLPQLGNGLEEIGDRPGTAARRRGSAGWCRCSGATGSTRAPRGPRGRGRPPSGPCSGRRCARWPRPPRPHWARAAMIRLRFGKLYLKGGVPSGSSVITEPAGDDLRAQLGVPRRVADVDAAAEHRDGRSRRPRARRGAPRRRCRAPCR